MLRGLTRTPSSIPRPDPSGECAGHSLHAPPTGGGRPQQGCGTGCIRVWYKRDHIAPRISGRSRQSRAAAVHKTTFGGRESVMHGIVGTEAAIARPSDGIAAATLLANDRNSRGSGVVGKFFDRNYRSLVPSFPPAFFGSGPTFAMGTAGWMRLGARGRAVKMDRIRANVVGASANKIGWLPIRSSASREASATRASASGVGTDRPRPVFHPLPAKW